MIIGGFGGLEVGNWSYRVVGGWWRNLEFGGWKVNYFEDGGWRMKVKNKNEILDQIKNLSFAINKNGYFRFGAL